ncbi:MAG: serine/threonine-protein kinase [Planctomycetota bacterium]
MKPSNLLLEAGGEVWVTDFGLAKTDEVDLTETGAVVGTLRYMAPERFDGECDGGADVYALGATLYELITLRPAFGGTDRMQIIENIRSAEPVSLRSIDGRIPADLEIIVQKALAKEPSRRYPTAQAMAEDLGRFIEDRPIRARRVSATQRLVRWSRRNRALATSLVGVFALLIAVTAVSAIGQRRERNQRENLERELYQSQMRLAGIASGSVLGLHEVDRITANLQQYPALHGWEWFHLDALARQHQLKLQLGEGTHGGRIGWSPNGKYLFASDPQGDVHVIDFASGEVVERFADHETHVMSISTSPDGSLLVTASLDGVIQIRDAVSWERRARFVVLEEKGQLFGVDVHPDSTMIFAHLNGLRSRIYRIAGSGGTLVRELSEVTGGGSFSPDGRYLATQVKARMDRDADSRGWIPSATVWDAESFTRIATCFAPVVDVPKSPRWNADGSSIAWGSLEGPLVWTDWTATTDARLLEFTRNQHGPRPAAERISWSPDGQSFATAARDGIVRIWDPRAGTDWRQFSGNGDVLSDVSWQPAGTIVATLSRDLQVRAWDTAVGSPVQDFEFPYRSVGYLAWSPDSRKLLRGPSRRHVVDVETEEITPFPHGAPIWIGNRFLGMRGLLPGAAPAVQRIVSEFLPGETLHKISGVPGHGVFMTTREGRLLRQDELLQSPPVEIATGIEWLHYAMTVAADGSRVAVGLYRDVCCYDGHTGAVLFNVPMLTKTDVLDFDPNSRWLAAVGERPEVRLLDARTGELHVELIGHLIAPRAVEFHPDGSRIATGGNDGTVRLWDPETGDLITIFEEGSEVHAVAWSPDGRRLATQLDDGSVRVRDARDYPIHRRRR